MHPAIARLDACGGELPLTRRLPQGKLLTARVPALLEQGEIVGGILDADARGIDGAI